MLKHFNEITDEDKRKHYIFYMKKALEMANKAIREKEVAVGCVIVMDSEIISTGHNLTCKYDDPTRHAELVAFDKLFRKYPDAKEKLEKSVLYVTVEPCVMCASAIKMLNIKKVVYGCKNIKFGGCGSIYEINSSNLMPTLNSYKCVCGVMEDEAREALQVFYSTPNPNTS